MKRIMLAVLLLLALAVPSNISAVPVQSINPTVDVALRSVVHIVGTIRDDEGDPHIYGCSAFAVSARKLVTAAHCYPDGAFHVYGDGVAVFPVKIDRDMDLAILLWDKIVPTLELRLEPLIRHESVTGLGFGYSLAFPTITDHKVMMLNYTPDVGTIFPGTWFMGGFIGGMSGGPVIDKDGLVVGIVQRGSEFIGYGVDAKTIADFIDGVAKE